MDETQENLPLGLRCSNHCMNLATLPLQVPPFLLDAKVYPVLQMVGAANMAQHEGVVSYLETTEKSKWNVHYFVLI